MPKMDHSKTKSQVFDSKSYPPNIQMLESRFLDKLKSYQRMAKYYANPLLQAKAKEHIPASDLVYKSEIQHAMHLTSTDASQESLGIEDFLVLELLTWFKDTFFHWIDNPTCSNCGITMSSDGRDVPNVDEVKWDAQIVELHKCKTCCSIVRFPRYNNPEKLLVERRGRCGEWANCFTLCCCALGLEARLVIDWSDHVWTEVFSPTNGCWVHCDPCENLYDAPLVYELGWKKELTYVIAFSFEGIQDVTWRYTSDHVFTLSRRLLCRELWLLNIIMSINEDCWNRVGTERKTELLQRTVCELAGFIIFHREISEKEKQGRISGSVKWRTARREMGDSAVDHSSFIWSITSDEIQRKYFHLLYSAAADKYVRVSSDNVEMNGWRSGLYKCQDAFRKVEQDWKMAYLARIEGSQHGSITWRFDCSQSLLCVDTITVKCLGHTFENGQVTWILKGLDRKLDCSGSMMTTTDIFSGSKFFTLTAKLYGGKGNTAWQHAQLFRQAIRSVDEFPFEIKVSFKCSE